jgi:hypothetical protein
VFRQTDIFPLSFNILLKSINKDWETGKVYTLDAGIDFNGATCTCTPFYKAIH